MTSSPVCSQNRIASCSRYKHYARDEPRSIQSAFTHSASLGRQARGRTASKPRTQGDTGSEDGTQVLIETRSRKYSSEVRFKRGFGETVHSCFQKKREHSWGIQEKTGYVKKESFCWRGILRQVMGPFLESCLKSLIFPL